MAETSVEFAKLELSLAEARGLLSDLPHHDVGDSLQQLKLKSYVLLCHAAIEEYLESLSLSVLSESLKRFEEDKKIRDPLLAASSYYKILLSEEASTRNKGDVAQDFLMRLFRKAISEHTASLDGVHGIKTKDQDAILLPIGVRLFDFDRILSQSLNSFGGVRGKYAHSLGFKVVTPRAGLEKTVQDIFKLLNPLDNMLCKRYDLSYIYE